MIVLLMKGCGMEVESPNEAVACVYALGLQRTARTEVDLCTEAESPKQMNKEDNHKH